jgi:hypothetical protein
LTSLRTISREATKPAGAMSFYLAILTLSALADGLQCFLDYRKAYRMAMRHGMAGGFTFPGIDHLVHAHNHHVPVLPDVLGE